MVNKRTREVICTQQRRGKTHDYKVFKQSNCRIGAATRVLADAGYQGLQSEHENSQTPVKKPKGGQLSESDKQANRELGRERVCVENVIRHLKIFRIVSERYRNRRRRFKLRFDLIAGLYNYELMH